MVSSKQLSHKEGTSSKMVNQKASSIKDDTSSKQLSQKGNDNPKDEKISEIKALEKDMLVKEDNENQSQNQINDTEDKKSEIIMK